MAEMKKYLQITNLSKIFGKFIALENINLDIYEGEFVFLLGPSGCGKTTLLRIIAGLETPTQGTIIQNGIEVTHLPPSKRDFGIVFQSYALFPNLTAAQNIAYGLENKKLPRSHIEKRVNELLHMIGLEKFAAYYPSQLSGGQQQRVALARALAISPSLLLLDEPLSALDAKVRANLRTEIVQLQKRLNITTIMVSHDQEEALTMADRVVVMDQGKIVQVDVPEQLYKNPLTPFVANFVGLTNFLPAMVTSQEESILLCGDQYLKVAYPLNLLANHQEVTVSIRPEDIEIINGTERNYNVLPATLKGIEFIGPFYHFHLEATIFNKPIRVLAYVPSQKTYKTNFKKGDRLSIHLPSDAMRVYPYNFENFSTHIFTTS